MAQQQLSNFHYAYIDMIRHYHPESEKYTGADALFTAVENNWEIEDTVRYETHWLMGGRNVVVYYFDLTLGNEKMTMPILTTPYITRVLGEMKLKLIELAEKHTQPVVKR